MSRANWPFYLNRKGSSTRSAREISCFSLFLHFIGLPSVCYPRRDISSNILVEGERESAVRRFALKIEHWNEQLQELADEFRDEHEGSSTFVYDTTPIFNEVLDNPQEHGFTNEKSFGESKDIWCDRAHVGGAMHKILAQDIAAFLDKLPAESR